MSHSCSLVRYYFPYDFRIAFWSVTLWCDTIYPILFFSSIFFLFRFLSTLYFFIIVLDFPSNIFFLFQSNTMLFGRTLGYYLAIHYFPSRLQCISYISLKSKRTAVVPCGCVCWLWTNITEAHLCGCFSSGECWSWTHLHGGLCFFLQGLSFSSWLN